MANLLENLLEKKLREKGFTKVEVIMILLVMSEVCNICWNEPAESATCWRDD